jgi:hypothetical protein
VKSRPFLLALSQAARPADAGQEKAALPDSRYSPKPRNAQKMIREMTRAMV